MTSVAALPKSSPARVLACGAYLKNTACLIQDRRVFWSLPHGDLTSAVNREALEASVDESHWGAIRVGQPVSVTLDGAGQALAARLSEIVSAVDAASRAYTVKIDLPAAASLRSGMFGHAEFQLGTREVLTLPAAAVAARGQLQSVFVVDSGIARTRQITTGEKARDRVEVLSGLTQGEQVILPVPPGLSDGAAVEVRR